MMDMLSGDGGYSLSGGTATSGNTSGNKTNGQTVIFGNSGTGNGDQLLIVSGVLLVLFFLKK